MKRLSIRRRGALLAASALCAVLSQNVGAHASVVQSITSNGRQSCGPTTVIGNGETTWTCAMTTLSNVSPAFPEPDAGVFSMSATSGNTSGFPCPGTSASFAPLTANGEYRDELGTISWSGSVPYADDGMGDCVTSYGTLTAALKVTGTGFYVNIDELCVFYALGPDTPSITAGGPGVISFSADSSTGCAPVGG